MLNKVLSDKIKCEYCVKRCFWVFGIRATISKVKQLNTESKYRVCKRDLKLQWEKVFLGLTYSLGIQNLKRLFVLLQYSGICLFALCTFALFLLSFLLFCLYAHTFV